MCNFQTDFQGRFRKKIILRFVSEILLTDFQSFTFNIVESFKKISKLWDLQKMFGFSGFEL